MMRKGDMIASDSVMKSNLLIVKSSAAYATWRFHSSPRGMRNENSFCGSGRVGRQMSKTPIAVVSK